MYKEAKFNIGDCVIHQRYGYRAVIIDADPLFQASGRINPQASKRAFAIRNPWYRLLVDNTSHITYVEECHLRLDKNEHKIVNPKLNFYLKEQQGRYHSQAQKH